MIVGFLSQLTMLVPGMLVLLIGISLFIRKSQTIFRWYLVFQFLLLFLATPLARNIIVNPLENNFEQLIEVPRDTKYILVLSAGHTYSDNRPAISQINPSSLARLIEGVRIWRKTPDAELIVTGDIGNNLSGATQSSVAAEAARFLGVDNEKIIELPDTSNTYEEIKGAAQVSGEHKIIIVTSAVHMTRAMTLAENLSIEALPAPINFMVSDSRTWWKFGATYLLHIDRALHEYMGLLFLKLQKTLNIES